MSADQSSSGASANPAGHPQRKRHESVTIRFAGDSGDGMQLAGTQFSQATAQMGNDLSTFPDFPAEIRAPAGTTYGVSGFQIRFASHEVTTPGDHPDVLVAMNPAALKVNLEDLRNNGLLVINTGAFTKANLTKAGYDENPLENGSLDAYRQFKIDISKLTLAAVKELGLGAKEAQRCKNLWTLGLMYWLFGRDKETTVSWLRTKFAKREDLATANIAALNAGHAYAETAELPSMVDLYEVPKAPLEPGLYRNISGNQATAWGLVAGAHLADLPLFYGSYPITPASTLLHSLASLKRLGVTTFQAEDEIAAACAAVGASYGGALGVCASSGPGMVLKTETIGLAIGAELPLVVVDVQRAGPSTGLPTKTEQSDLLMALYGRNGDAPLVVLAAASAGDCFYMAIEAVRIATTYMTPVILLTDGYIANGAEPWPVPDFGSLKPFPVRFRTETEGFHPFLRDEKTLARVWAKPGTPGLEHRIGGIERSYDTGHISYDPNNHERMTRTRADKIAGVADSLPRAKVSSGDDQGDLLIVGWGGTRGALHEAVARGRAKGQAVSHLHLRHLNPLPHGLEALLKRFKRVVVAEINDGMLVKVLRSEFLVPAESYTHVNGKPLSVDALEAEIDRRLALALSA